LAKGSWQRAVGKGQLAVGKKDTNQPVRIRVGSRQWAVGSRQLAVGKGQLAVGKGQLAMALNQLHHFNTPILHHPSS